MAATLRVPTIFTAVDRVSRVVNSMGRNTMAAMDRVGRGVNGANRLFNRLTPSIGEAGKQLLEYVSAATIAAAAFSGVNFGIQSILDYEVALHSLSAVTGESTSKFKGQIEDIATKTKKSAIDVTSSFEIIGSAMSQYLDNPKALGQITEAGITLAKASRQELEPALESLTSVMNQFNKGAEEADKVINILTAGEIVGSVSTAKGSEQLAKFGAIADNLNVTLPESIALIQTLGKKFTGPMQSEIGTASKNMLMIMDASTVASKDAQSYMKKHKVNLNVLTDRTLSLGTRIKELSKIQKDGAAMALVFGKENATAGSVIFDQLDTYTQWEKEIRETNKAQEQAATNSDTIKNRIEEVKNSFLNWAVSGDKLNPTLEKVKERLVWIADNMGLVVTWVGRIIGGFIGIKAAIYAAQIAMAAYNISLGIFAALNTSSAISLGTNVLALRAWYITTLISGKAMMIWAGIMKVVTGVQWLWNAAMTANPIGLIIVGIAALIGLVASIIYYWDEWGSVVAVFLGPLGMVISFVMELYKRWDEVKKAFAEGGIIGALKAIGRILMSSLLKPIESLLAGVAKIPGLTKIAGGALENLTKFRQQFDEEDKKDGAQSGTPALVSPSVKQGQLTNESINTTRNTIDLNLTNQSGLNAGIQQRGPLNIPVKVTPTNGRK